MADDSTKDGCGCEDLSWVPSPRVEPAEASPQELTYAQLTRGQGDWRLKDPFLAGLITGAKNRLVMIGADKKAGRAKVRDGIKRYALAAAAHKDTGLAMAYKFLAMALEALRDDEREETGAKVEAGRVERRAGEPKADAEPEAEERERPQRAAVTESGSELAEALEALRNAPIT